jgi:MFS family permease
MTMVLPLVAAPVLAAGMILALALWILARMTRVRTGVLIGILVVGILVTGIPGTVVAVICINYVSSRYADIAISFLIGFLVYAAVMALAFRALRKRTRREPNEAALKKQEDNNEANNNLITSAESRADAASSAGQIPAGHDEIHASTTRPRQVPIWVSLLVFLGMFLGAMALITTDPAALAFAWLFPYGLCGILCMVLGSPQSEVLGMSLLVVSFAIYIVMLVAFVRTRTWIRFAVLCFILACLLLLNVAGCEMMGAAISKIGN